MPRRRERIPRSVLGLIVVILGVILFLGLLMAGIGRRLVTPRTTLRADFRTASGLRRGSTVRLAGVPVGRVSAIKFVNVSYACDPLTEDLGRHGDGRTDNCDSWLFCTSKGLCGELEPWAGKGEHTQCDTSEDCAEDETCITSEFRSHATHVDWAGPIGLCARAQTLHWRALVEMDVRSEAMDFIRTDSTATIASNSALGDNLVDISPGHGRPLGEDRRIQTRPSLSEDIDRLRQRVERFTYKAEDSVVAILHVLNELRDEPTIDALEGFFFNVEVISRDLAHGRGVLGALVGSPRIRRDIGKIVASVRGTSSQLEDSVQGLNRIQSTVDRNSGPLFADADAALVALDEVLKALADPSNRSLVAQVLRDPEGKLVDDLEHVVGQTRAIVGSAAAITEAVDNGRGTLGRLINDPLVARQVGRLLRSVAEHDLLRFALEIVLERNGIPVSKARSAAGPPR